MPKIKRVHIRFSAEPNTFVTVKTGEGSTIGGLAIDESQGGCSAVFLKSDRLKKNGVCYIKVGELAPIKAEIKWLLDLDKDLVRIGFCYLS